jgi:hypothetical protein
MSRPHAGPDRTVLLPSSVAWNADARLVGEVLETVWAAAARDLTDTRYQLPALTWQIAAEVSADCATTDYRPEHLRVATLPVYALDAVWACHDALLQAVDSDTDSRLASVLSYYLDAVHSIDLRSLIGALERVLAVLSLDLPAARTLVSHLVLSPEASAKRAALDEVIAAWRRAGVAC